MPSPRSRRRGRCKASPTPSPRARSAFLRRRRASESKTTDCGNCFLHRPSARMLAANRPKEKLFFVSFAAFTRHNLLMVIAIGAFLNAIGILLGAIFGLARRQPVSGQTQLFFRNALGAATIFFGLRLAWLNVGGNFLSCAKQI